VFRVEVQRRRFQVFGRHTKDSTPNSPRLLRLTR
jgi:hypothetical protein